MRTTPSPGLAPFEKQTTILLTTYKRDGTGVGTPVNVAVDGDRAYFRTVGSAGKVKRIRNFPEVEFRASTWRGRPVGPPVRARARLLDADTREFRRAERSLTRKYPLIHGLVAPLVHRLRRERTLHYELRLVEDAPPP
ncbi:PPOX class F420-dependent oxidoreductase [Streptomyces sp. BHT-5-2]|uniref:PPOX class F420-dependent oxidoreductase n=1 Tax=unclassified Streptomyces TaxID=2593676 RepID=UPI001C8EF627|nr:PPOX class F420-dependent oxidoreductase [Streptomyces sp. BHT-5-2]QZL03449.1 PPOX class F420-dependent oxidoreductase [Streptomyces sp. BHT-5-2]